MSNDIVWKVKEGQHVHLDEYDPGYTGKFRAAQEVQEEVARSGEELGGLQELLAEAQVHSVLMVLQGMDTSGKDGTIRHVFSHVNPQGCSVSSFKEPTPEELAHDFLWRVHRATPRKGMLTIFNRSHYEDVLVARVHDLVPEDVWRHRYKAINQFERLLTSNHMLILKFFLYISADEQKQRLQARVQNKEKSWKISVSDFVERRYWDAYQEAYEDALSKCSTDEAPWYIVPANHKWYRNFAIAHTLVATLRDYKHEWQKEVEERGQRELKLLHEMQEREEDQKRPS